MTFRRSPILYVTYVKKSSDLKFKSMILLNWYCIYEETKFSQYLSLAYILYNFHRKICFANLRERIFVSKYVFLTIWVIIDSIRRIIESWLALNEMR